MRKHPEGFEHAGIFRTPQALGVVDQRFDALLKRCHRLLEPLLFELEYFQRSDL